MRNRFDGEINAFQPEDEKESFILKVEDTTVLINAGHKTFTPLKRGDADVYMQLKEFFSNVGLRYNSRSMR
jgi:hypothetical protein